MIDGDWEEPFETWCRHWRRRLTLDAIRFWRMFTTKYSDNKRERKGVALRFRASPPVAHPDIVESWRVCYCAFIHATRVQRVRSGSPLEWWNAKEDRPTKNVWPRCWHYAHVRLTFRLLACLTDSRCGTATVPRARSFIFADVTQRRSSIFFFLQTTTEKKGKPENQNV